ncbi:PREDICTED: glucan endo-1,3-beta-glucosidase isoform X2 [Tarenaya hassleriana]|uniref:glucan endo-1,3-beta-glucosidase isoform X2 n=1 Tax=Tarenaya hassleriana TaxID=28532 RepID=UPI00053C3A9F|nr:PREDICTED: glucan endo-1,3-beta-glucosidase isoform X2 [Tarenaya hassleriana]
MKTVDFFFSFSSFKWANMVVMVVAVFINFVSGVEASIGVNYGTLANNLQPPRQVAEFLLRSTVINRVRLFDTDPQILRSFSGTGIATSVTVPNDLIPNLTNLSFAQQWLSLSIQPFFPSTNIVRILVGNEVLSTGNRLLIGNLVPAMQSLHTALASVSLHRRIQISTPHSLGILSNSSPPSSGKFRQGYDTHVLKPLLSFLKATDSPFMVNPYPFFGCSSDTLDLALFRPNPGLFDEDSKLLYTNMLDAQLDSVYSALDRLGFPDVEIVIGETGWPSAGDDGQIGADPETAAEYNKNLLARVNSGVGTPLMPNRTFETYIFALFNEDLKSGPTCERNFGLFRPDMTPVYDIGILRPTAPPPQPPPPPAMITVVFYTVCYQSQLAFYSFLIYTARSSNPNDSPWNSPPPSESTGKRWCVAKSEAEPADIQRNIDYVCGLGLDCRPSKENGPCFDPDVVQAHSAYAMNLFYHTMGKHDFDCDFTKPGL